jgi:hypothetical protein
MTQLSNGELQVVVPVGFLLDQEREVMVHVPRGEGSDLPIRLKLVPAQVPAHSQAIAHPPARLGMEPEEEVYPAYELGVGD